MHSCVGQHLLARLLQVAGGAGAAWREGGEAAGLGINRAACYYVEEDLSQTDYNPIFMYFKQVQYLSSPAHGAAAFGQGGVVLGQAGLALGAASPLLKVLTTWAYMEEGRWPQQLPPPAGVVQEDCKEKKDRFAPPFIMYIYYVYVYCICILAVASLSSALKR